MLFRAAGFSVSRLQVEGEKKKKKGLSFSAGVCG